MTETFNIDEIFEIAEQIERNGAKFYRRAAANAGDTSAGKLLLELAEMEVDHEKRFARLRQELASGDYSTEVYDPQGEAAQYLQSMATGKVFNLRADPSEKLTGSESLGDVLITAIGLERDSIAYYTGIKELVPGRLGGERIDEIIREEMGHLRLLANWLENL